MINLGFKKDSVSSILLILLGLLSFGGGTGRFLIGLAPFDFFLFAMVVASFFKNAKKLLIFRKMDALILSLFLLILFVGLFSTVLGRTGISYDYVITEVRFFIYFIALYYVAASYELRLSVIRRAMPYFLIAYIILWGLLLKEGGWLFRYFNTEDLHFVGDQVRINGPLILLFAFLIMILIKEDALSLISLILYIALVFLVFFKTGSRAYFIFNLMPVFYLMYMKKKSIKQLFFPIVVISSGFIFLHAFVNQSFFDRFVNIFNPSADSAFMYRVFNIEEMLSRVHGWALWLGNGIGSTYEIYLFGWRDSFFLDNTFVTLIYKVGVVGVSIFLLFFIMTKKIIPSDFYYFLVIGLLVIASISYHIILNPVFLFGYFLVLNYFRASRAGFRS